MEFVQWHIDKWKVNVMALVAHYVFITSLYPERLAFNANAIVLSNMQDKGESPECWKHIIITWL